MLWENTMNAIGTEAQISIPTGSGESSNEESQNITGSEKEQIQEWISENNLNQYGDPGGTMYAGGTPLFNEMTGEQIDLYDYILERHPDRPWKK